MRYIELTMVLELSEEITTVEQENALHDDIVSLLLDKSEYVSGIRSYILNDCTRECEEA